MAKKNNDQNDTGPKRIVLRNVGQIKEADVTFGDLTVIVGPQATGKSVFLQWLKLVVDQPAVQREMLHYNFNWKSKWEVFANAYFGEGMASIWHNDSMLSVDGIRKTLPGYARKLSESKLSVDEALFYIPAQRVMSLQNGQTRPFQSYNTGDPFVLRDFSEKLHNLLQTELGNNPELFPPGKRLKKEVKEQISKNVFGEFKLKLDTVQFSKQIVLSGPKDTKLPYLVWSAGQREFVPLLLGLYWLLPESAISRRKNLQWAVLEEVEMGLHPDAISMVLWNVMELLSRGYKVVLSTHSPHVLDIIWGMRILQEELGTEKDLLEMFGLPQSSTNLKSVAKAALEKEYKVYFFQRDGIVADISGLDPAAENTAESFWGGLTEFTGRVGNVVSRVVNRAKRNQA